MEERKIQYLKTEAETVRKFLFYGIYGMIEKCSSKCDYCVNKNVCDRFFDLLISIERDI